jgi:hypothetical protein
VSNRVRARGAAPAAAFRLRMLTGCGIHPADAVCSAAVQATGSAVVLNVMLWVALAVSPSTQRTNIWYVVAAGLGLALSRERPWRCTPLPGANTA